jgi:hypothetical protein
MRAVCYDPRCSLSDAECRSNHRKALDEMYFDRSAEYALALAGSSISETLKAGVVYFALVFAAGFVLGRPGVRVMMALSLAMEAASHSSK